ncbi:hypothetical protein Tco_1051292 [Tanacetum coccineum]
MSTRSSTRNLFPPLEDPERTIRRRTRVDPNLLNNFEEINMAANGNGTKGYEDTIVEVFKRHGDRIQTIFLRQVSHHGFSNIASIDTFTMSLNSNDQDLLNSAAGGNFLDKMPRECLRIIESKSKVCNSRNKPVVAKVGTITSTPDISPDVAALSINVAELKDMMKTLILDKQKSQAPATVKAVEGKKSANLTSGAHSYRNCPVTDGNVYRWNIFKICFPSTASG